MKPTNQHTLQCDVEVWRGHSSCVRTMRLLNVFVSVAGARAFLGARRLPALRRAAAARALGASAAAGVDDNPLLEQSALPLFEKIAPEHVQPAIETLVERLDRDFADFEAALAGGSDGLEYGDVIEALEKMQAPLE